MQPSSSQNSAGYTEKEKMLAGELYTASDPELVAEYRRAHARLALLNASAASESAARIALLRELFAHLGDDAAVQPTFRCDYGYNISVGARTFINYDCVFLDCNRISIGEEVQIAPGVHLYTATHPVDAATRRSGLELARPITIASGVWLGGRTVVLPGLSIGENTVVGAGSVVTRSLPANVVAAGNPCRVLRSL